MKKREGDGSALFVSSNSRRGQVTIFVILAIIIVAIAALIYFLYPKIKSTFNPNSNPDSYIQSCVHDKLQEIVYNVSMQGGYMNPQHFVLYNNSKVEYLCYTNKNLQPCTMQQPLLQSYIESQIESYIKPTADSCFQNLKDNYQKKGYTADLVMGNITASLIPNKILVRFNNKLTLTKSNTQRYDTFIVSLNSNLYELIGIANNILQWETRYGDVNVGAYMTYFHNILVQKPYTASDGTKIYSVTDMDSGDSFQFAVRSIARPAGFGGVY